MTGLEKLSLSHSILNQSGFIAPQISIGEDYVTLTGYREEKQLTVTVHVQESSVFVSADKDKPFDPSNFLNSDFEKYLKDPAEKQIEDAVLRACYLDE